MLDRLERVLNRSRKSVTRFEEVRAAIGGAEIDIGRCITVYRPRYPGGFIVQVCKYEETDGNKIMITGGISGRSFWVDTDDLTVHPWPRESQETDVSTIKKVRRVAESFLGRNKSVGYIATLEAMRRARE